MRSLVYSTQFKKDLKRLKKQGKNFDKFKSILELLIENKPLPQNLHDHPLKSNWSGFRDLHIEPDWVLIYKTSDLILRFERTGSHSELFK